MIKEAALSLLFQTLFIVAGGTPASAQEVRATIGGRVTDAQGALVPDANVTVVSGETGVRQTTRTNPQGNWTVQFLLPGHYDFRIAAPGFKTADRRGVTLQTSDNKQIDVQLELGSASQSVEVSGDAPLIDTTSASSGTVITSEEITELPSASHVATLFAVLSPGVVAQDQNNNVVHLWSYNGASQFTANGGRNNIYSNNFLLDGFPDVRAAGDIAFSPPLDTLAEFRVQTNAYDASIGRQAGSTINMSTKSGAGRYHGTLYEFNQNNILNANLFQTNLVGGVVPPVHFNEFGGTFGGPVWIPKIYKGTQKTFFFVSWEDTHNKDPRPGSTRSVPTALERMGDFSQSFTTQLANGQLQRFPIQVYDPLTVDSSGNRQQFPGNVIPQSRLSPIAQKLLAYVPLPNTTGDPTGNAVTNFVSSATRQDLFPVLSVRGDQNWSNSQRSFAVVRWDHLDESLDDYFHNAATGGLMQRIAKQVGIDHVWTIGANKVLDLRFSVARFEQPQHDKGSGFDLAQLGFSPSFISQLTLPSFPRITGFAGDFGAAQAGTYQINTDYTWQAGLTHVHGNHTMRYGAEYWVLQEADGGIGAQPQFDFSNVWTRQSATVGGGTGIGSAPGSFLLGLPSGGSAPSNANALYSQHFTAFYFQDDWRVGRKLTVNLGLRWDYERPVVERYNRITSDYDPTALNPISAAVQANYAQILAANPTNPGVQLLASFLPANAFKVPGAQLFAGVNGRARTATNGDFHEWQPRVGFAYLIGPNTVVRGGIGRFAQASFEVGGQNGFSRTTPLISSQDNNFTPFDTLADPFRGGILTPTGASLGPLTNLGQGVSWLNPNAGRAYSWEYSLHLQHQIRSWLFEAGYSHNKTYNIYQGRNRNLPSFALWQQLQAPVFDSTGRPVDILPWNTLVPNPFNKVPGISGGIGSTAQVSINQLLNPNPLLGGITENDMPLGKNQYDALLIKVEHRFSHGFSVINSFTWSKLFEDTTLIGPEIAGAVVEHKLGGEDRPFHYSVAPIWTLPVGRGRKIGGSMPVPVDLFAGGWEIAGNYNLQSGVPVVFGTDSFFTGNNFALPKDKQSLNQWFDTTQFLPFPSRNTNISNYPAWTGIQNLPGYNYVPAANDTIRNGVYQDFANNIRRFPTRWGNVRASRVNEANLGLYKNIRFTERSKLQLRFDAFNLFNHPRFAAPDTNPGSSTFGRVTPSQQNAARTIELGARVTF